MIDYERLRNDLIDYFGTAMTFNPMAMSDLISVERASNDELVEIALKNNFDLNKYKNKIYYK